MLTSLELSPEWEEVQDVQGIFRHTITQEQYRIHILNNPDSDFLKFYEDRKSYSCNMAPRIFKISPIENSALLPKSEGENLVMIFIEEPKWRFLDIEKMWSYEKVKTFCKHKFIQIVKAIYVLSQQFGIFRLTPNLIGFDANFNTKIWFNQNYGDNEIFEKAHSYTEVLQDLRNIFKTTYVIPTSAKTIKDLIQSIEDAENVIRQNHQSSSWNSETMSKEYSETVGGKSYKSHYKFVGNRKSRDSQLTKRHTHVPKLKRVPTFIEKRKMLALSKPLTIANTKSREAQNITWTDKSISDYAQTQINMNETRKIRFKITEPEQKNKKNRPLIEIPSNLVERSSKQHKFKQEDFQKRCSVVVKTSRMSFHKQQDQIVEIDHSENDSENNDNLLSLPSNNSSNNASERMKKRPSLTVMVKQDGSNLSSNGKRSSLLLADEVNALFSRCSLRSALQFQENIQVKQDLDKIFQF